ncbi:MAG: eukaryotic-like serine/threonine-protein kinase [Candidatus Sumerlaeota bacterium]|nr:eukaryotic-like serine/threonine-protein kinase [Candidatus Sumerlaeota bacterium]
MYICISVTGRNRQPTTFVFDKGEISLGRSSKNDLRFDPELDGAVSRHHALIRRDEEDGCYYLKDLGSTQGTFVNDVMIDGEVPLRTRDSVVLGINGPRLRVTYESTHESTIESSVLLHQRSALQFPLALYRDFPKRYHLFVKVGEGGYGQVWKAQPRGSDQWFAIKFLRPELLMGDSSTAFIRSSKAVQRFQREAELMERLWDKGADGIARIYEAGGDQREGFLYMIMDFIDGEPLDRFVTRRKQMEEQQVLAILRSVAESLDRAHSIEWWDAEKGRDMKGIVHRDIKPSNIILRSSDNRAILCDFGIAAIQEGGDRLTLPQARVSSYKFTAPEVLLSNVISPATDLWGLAVTGYVLISGGFFPYSGMGLGPTLRNIREGNITPIIEYRPEISAPVAEFLHRALDPEPSRRLATAREWIERIDSISSAE